MILCSNPGCQTTAGCICDRVGRSPAPYQAIDEYIARRRDIPHPHEATISQLQAEIDRMRKERDRERKHVSKLMGERDHARKALDEANCRIRELHHNPASGARATFERCQTALEHASHALDGVVSLDGEDEGKDGGSATCQHAKRTVDRALKEVRAALGGSND